MTSLDVITQPTLDELQLPVDRIRPNPDNVRSDLGDLSDLIESVRTHGVHTPALVYPDGDGWILIAGHRRHAAAIAAGRTTMPAVVREQPDQVTLLELMLSENNQRDPLDPIDEAKALVRIKTAGSYRRLEQIAARVNRSKEWVAGRLRLVQGLPEDLWPKVSAGDVTLGDALKVAGLKVPDAEKRRLFLQPTQIARAVDDDRRARARAELEQEYGPLLAPSELHLLRTQHPWGLARLGIDYGELNQPVAMHRGACDGHVAILAFDGVTPQAFCTKPLDHLGQGIHDSGEPWDIPDNAEPVKALGLAGTAYLAHREHCPHHATFALPWGEVDVCLDPSVHADGAQFDTAALVELYKSTTPSPANSTRWRVPADAHQLLDQRLREALADLPDWTTVFITGSFLVGSIGDDETPTDVLVRTGVEEIVHNVESLQARVEWLDVDDAPLVPAINVVLQACVDVGAPPPNLDEIRTRIDVITKGEGSDDA